MFSIFNFSKHAKYSHNFKSSVITADMIIADYLISLKSFPWKTIRIVFAGVRFFRRAGSLFA